MQTEPPDVVITEFMDADAVDRLERRFAVLYEPDLVNRPDALGDAVAGARGLIVRNRTQVRGALLDAAEKLSVVGRLGVGLDNIDLAACEARSIEVIPATGANARAVAEYVIAAMLIGARNAYQARAVMLEGAWPRNDLVGREIGGKTLGLVGYGTIARMAAARARAFDVKIIAHDPFVAADDPAWTQARRVDLDTLISEADFISVHVPLNGETQHLIDADCLAAMKPGAFLINTARGGIVDDSALADAVRRGHLSGAALDVFETEPLSSDAASVFADLETVVLTPHIAGVTEESNVRVSAMIADAVIRHLDHS